MASSEEYLDFVLDGCSGLSARAMMEIRQKIDQNVEAYTKGGEKQDA